MKHEKVLVKVHSRNVIEVWADEGSSQLIKDVEGVLDVLGHSMGREYRIFIDKRYDVNDVANEIERVLTIDEPQERSTVEIALEYWRDLYEKTFNDLQVDRELAEKLGKELQASEIERDGWHKQYLSLSCKRDNVDGKLKEAELKEEQFEQREYAHRMQVRAFGEEIDELKAKIKDLHGENETLVAANKTFGKLHDELAALRTEIKVYKETIQYYKNFRDNILGYTDSINDLLHELHTVNRT